MQQNVSIDVAGSPMPSYLARPDGDSPRAAVIVLQEIFGVNREVKRIAELFASAGYVALAINYYHRTDPTLDAPYTSEGLQRGFAAAGTITRATISADVAAAVAWLDAQPFVRPGAVAACGFCFGGTMAFLSATMPGIKAAIPFYGGQIATDLPSGEPGAAADAAAVRAPLLLFFGGKDEYITHDAIASIDKALLDAGKAYEIVSYPDVGHAFFRESSQALGEHEVADAWAKVRLFLEQHLGAG